MSKYSICLSYLREMSFRLDIDPKSDQFRRIAFSKAAESLANAGTLDGIRQLKGIGPSILADLEQVALKGTCDRLKEARKSGPPVSVMELMRVRHIGPKTAIKLYENGISSLEDLEKAIKAHQVVDPKIVQAFYAAASAFDRVSRTIVEARTAPIIAFLNKQPNVSRVMIMGSFRRYRSDVRDIDVLITVKSLSNAAAVVASATKFLGTKLTLEGGRKANMDLDIDGIMRNLELMFCVEREQGCSTLHFTGSKDFNVACRKVAERKGYMLNQYSLTNNDSGKEIFFDTEEAVLDFLDLPYVPPQCRDAYLFQTPSLPPLVEASEIIGDLHVHTKDSDGVMSEHDVVKSATAQHYRIIGISDHSHGSGHGMKQDEAVARAQARRAHRMKIKGVLTFAGVELDVKLNGELDYDVTSLSSFDYVILALHADSEYQVQDRLTKAVNAIRRTHPRLPLIWAHPTGRLIGSRAEAEVDWGVIFRFCATNRIAIEINGQPMRLDLPDSKVMVAKRLGCKFIVGSDSHSHELNEIEPAVLIAQRALLTREDVLNAKSTTLANWLKGGY
jgi:DNA polymerase (family X)